MKQLVPLSPTCFRYPPSNQTLFTGNDISKKDRPTKNNIQKENIAFKMHRVEFGPLFLSSEERSGEPFASCEQHVTHVQH